MKHKKNFFFLKLISESFNFKSFTKKSNSTDTFYYPPCYVIGYPRTGFSLLLSMIAEVLTQQGHPCDDPRKRIFEPFFSDFTASINSRVLALLDSKNLASNLVFNDNFKTPLGGPNWLDDAFGRLCVRKYIGIKDFGDMTINIALPSHLINCHRIPHSHGPLSPWLGKNNDSPLLHTIRSPAGTINSACHSINAITSEYLQRWFPDQTETEQETIRNQLAMSKLTDLKFFEAMVQPMKTSFSDLKDNLESVNLFKLEDMLLTPIDTIIRVSSVLGISVHRSTAAQIWQRIGHRNLTQSHKHNYRPSSSKFNGQLNSLTNDHMEILLDYGFEDLANSCGVQPPKKINEDDYNDFQKRASAAIKNGLILDEVLDRELYWFAFQKTNIDFSKFNFRTFGWRENTKLERTNITNDDLLFGIWDIFESETEKLNNSIKNSL